MKDQQLGYVNARLGKVVCRAGKARPYLAGSHGKEYFAGINGLGRACTVHAYSVPRTYKKCSGSSYLLSLQCLSNLIKVNFELRNFQSSIAARNYFSILNCTELNCPLFRVISVLYSILSWFFSKNHAVIWQIYVTISVGPFSDT